ncbi:MAG TPA: putative baseplate assembly protein [Bacillota bacterium]|nr:putative baseplate assembly protein [Bacillota bacterium]
MLITPPKIDPRNQPVLIEQLQTLIRVYCPELAWEKNDEGKDPYAGALIHIFTGMMEKVIQRLNRAPEKNFLSFLNLLGISLAPPKAARAPLYFQMASGADQYGFIPAGTQVAAKEGSVVFETEQDLTVILPQLVKVISLNTMNDEWNDHSPMLRKDASSLEPERLFSGKERIPHRLYLGHHQLFSLKEKVTLTLTLTFAESINFQANDFDWYCYTDDPHEPSPIKLLSGAGEVQDKKFLVTLSDVNGVAPRTLEEKEPAPGNETGQCWNNYWIFGQLVRPVTQVTIPELKGITAGIMMSPPLKTGTGTIKKVEETNPCLMSGTNTSFRKELQPGDFITAAAETRMVTEILPDEQLLVNYKFDNAFPADVPFTFTTSRIPERAFYNHLELDLTKDFYPFGEQPKFNDTFYFGSAEIFSKPGALITMMVSRSSEVSPPVTKNIVLGWEYWNGARWVRMQQIKSLLNKLEVGQLEDLTRDFTEDGRIRFLCPAMEPTSVNGEDNYWFRVRIIKGYYGEEATDSEGNIKEDTPPTYKPPVISILAMTYELPFKETKPETVLAYNDFQYREYREADPEALPFIPFRQDFEEQLAVYLAFDQDIATLPVHLYFQLQRNSDVDASGGTSGAGNGASRELPGVTWEYWNGNSWRIFSVEDGTENLRNPGIVQFLAPADLGKRLIFGSEYYWIRIRVEGSGFALPRVEQILTNTVWAHNLITVRNEILGSGNGSPGQWFQMASSPALPGQKILVRETGLTEADRQAIIAEEGGDAILENLDAAGNVAQLWVRWHEVEYFYDSKPNSRHYRMDRQNGVVIFGDGVRGLIPPSGKDNIQCGYYQYGGGIQGNVAEKTITKLRTTFPYVDSVHNPIAAQGGSDQENLERAKVRGPQMIKNRQRAVTYEDFEGLVREASSKVAKVKCLSLSDPSHPGQIQIIIVPESADPKPQASGEMLTEIEAYLSGRTSGFLTQNVPEPGFIQLTGPGYLEVRVAAKVRLCDINSAKIVLNRIRENLDKFFHPVYGGPEGQGWEFGRNVYSSEVYEVIESTAGVDYVAELQLNAAMLSYQLEIKITSSAIYPKNSVVTAVRTEGEIRFSLAEDLTRILTEGENSVTITINVTGFKEGDWIIVKDPNRAQERQFMVKGITKGENGDWLACEPVNQEPTPADFPPQSTVESATAKSYLVEAGEELPNGYMRFKTATFIKNDMIVITHCQNFESTEPLTIQAKHDQVATIFVDPNYLVYSGNHQIDQVTE